MNQKVTAFIDGLDKPWQKELGSRLRALVHESLDGVEERIQYRKPHFLQDGKYLAVITPANGHIGFTIFSSGDVDMPADLFEGPPQRRTIKIKEGQPVDHELLARLLREAAATL
jgi:hypothetical protein